jgi:cytochrome c-type biogenesis protein CcmF
MPLDVPTLGTFVLYAALIACGYTFAVSLAAAGGRPRMLRSARMGTFATVALVACAVFLLAYAFQTHDFRIRYVARYSDRSMPAIYLWTSLWGGQDGSLLWWSFLLSGYTAAFTWWIGDRYRELQPYIFATLMTVFAFFFVLMLFAANPFATTFGPPPPDGEGLNPLLQNYWMVIHPPSLYMGLTGWAIPFAFVVAALITGRLGNEWILASRRWVLVAWGFLSLGNMLGMFWSYEELGWGGYWAWDPVENASFMPWLTATAYLHSVMIQERKGMLKVWNVFLLIWTFILTIFGTFLTRSGLIASVHSFARSDIGVYFAWYLVLLVAATTLLVAYRIPDLRYGWRIGSTEFAVAAGFGFVSALVLFVTGTEFDILLFAGAALLPAGLVGVVKLVEVLRLDVWKQPARVEGKRRIVESLLSREFAFLFNNWILIGMLGFVMISTTFPLLSEALRGETVTVGPEFYNQWMVPLGVILLFLMGVGPAISWRKATGKNLLQAFRLPALAGVVCAIGHVVGGSAAGFPAYVEVQPMYDTGIGDWLAFITGFSPVVCTSIAAFTMGTVLQEYWRGVRVRMKNKGEDPLTALVQLVSRARRRYGGYLVHAGIVLMYVGFTGAAYDTEREGALRPGQSLEVGAYELRYEGAIPEEDVNKRAVYGHLTLFRGGSEIGSAYPAKYIYRSHPEMPTTEVAFRHELFHDLYIIMAGWDPASGQATFRVIQRPLVSWIWFGGLLLLLGTFVAIAPTLKEVLGERTSSRPARRPRAAVAAATLLFVLFFAGLALVPGLAQAQEAGSSTLHAGSVEIHDPEERQLFERLLCECGDCQRLPLSTCGCSWAEGMRAELRARMDRSEPMAAIIAGYRERFGSGAISVPSDQGLDRALWVLPLALTLMAAIGLVAWVRRRGDGEVTPVSGGAGVEEYDDRLEEELRRLGE